MLPRKLQFLHPWLHLTGLAMILAGMPFSVFLMSFGQFWLIGNWILEAKFDRLKLFASSPAALLLSGLFLIYLPGVFYSENLPEAMKMLRLNLPFLVLPLILSQQKPLSKFWYFALLRFFLLAVVLATITCMVIGLPAWLNGAYTDIRQISLFISHIRFALLISFSILIISWLLAYKPVQMTITEKVFWTLAAVFMLVFLFILQSLTGLAIIAFTGSIWAAYLVFTKLPLKHALIVSSIPLIIIAFIAGISIHTYKNYFTPAAIYTKTLPANTALGNPYTHNKQTIENGYFIETFVCEAELIEAWHQRSSMPVKGDDGKGNRVQSTLIRYLNSKGLPKDAAGVASLSERDIAFIEQGIANEKYTGLWGIRMRFYQLLWEWNYFRQGHQDASGHTLRMKLEFWQTALGIIYEHPLGGVGIGDVPDAFRHAYQQRNSWLDTQWQMTSHNQYLYIAVAAGLPGLILFIFLLVWPCRNMQKLAWEAPFVFFMLIAWISMLTEDTLTTQAGITFVAFFYAFFLFVRPSAADKTTTISPLTPAK
ncbi:MAG: O-antigen ligase family protein [Bacteroidia bacterium]|nr:O-antigen ligase family protein [Bacteroidia bacterium]MCC6767459.1 O-antigen ligase family protein [Bacteroidia bacterium]